SDRAGLRAKPPREVFGSCPSLLAQAQAWARSNPPQRGSRPRAASDHLVPIILVAANWRGMKTCPCRAAQVRHLELPRARVGHRGEGAPEGGEERGSPAGVGGHGAPPSLGWHDARGAVEPPDGELLAKGERAVSDGGSRPKPGPGGTDALSPAEALWSTRRSRVVGPLRVPLG